MVRQAVSSVRLGVTSRIVCSAQEGRLSGGTVSELTSIRRER